MTPPQLIYLIAVSLYAAFFLLFCRFFWWKRYAERRYWRRRPELSIDRVRELAGRQGQELPFFSVLVPARNEASVIERTIDHLADLQYPWDRYEVVVITDEKELIASHADQARAVAEAAAFLRGRGGSRPGIGEQGEGLVLGLLSQLALKGWEGVRRSYGEAVPHGLEAVSEREQRALVRATAQDLWQGRGRVFAPRVMRGLRRIVPHSDEKTVLRNYAVLLSLAMPAVVALAHLKGDPYRKQLRRMTAQAARAHHALTQEILHAMTEGLAADTLRRLEPICESPRLERVLDAIYREVHPTTQDLVQLKARELALRGNVAALRHLVVPSDFDGRVGGRCLGHDVPSTKGRALNYALGTIGSRTRWCGFYDAESRPDTRVLLYVAFRDLCDGPRVSILQGPVFQVRNFYEMGTFCRIASLYQALAHDWYLPALFRRLPFVGGTNLFVRSDLLKQIGGYDQASLTEDLELGTRAFLSAGAWPEYLPYPSSEQTPPTLRSFYRQRLRWGTGHLQVMDKIRRSKGYPAAKRRALLRELFRKGQLEWVVYQFATFVPPAVMVLWWKGLVDPQILSEWVRWILNALSLVYIGFTIYAFFRYLPHVDPTGRPQAFWGRAAVILQLFFLPLAAFAFPVPYSSALVLKTLGLGPRTWHKTPRTPE